MEDIEYVSVLLSLFLVVLLVYSGLFTGLEWPNTSLFSRYYSHEYDNDYYNHHNNHHHNNHHRLFSEVNGWYQ